MSKDSAALDLVIQLSDRFSFLSPEKLDVFNAMTT